MKFIQMEKPVKTTKNVAGLIITGVLLAIFAFPAIAERNGDRKKLDTDGDGYVSQSEWDAVEHRGKSTFAELDVDGDGRISKDELKNHKRKEGRERARDWRE
jgi:flagellar biosynthesis/type III secretory pathway M-ring protein FliF/YscJ